MQNPGTHYAVGPIAATGAFTADFGLPGDMPLDQVVPLIERDRTIMAARPGMRQKHLPMLIDQQTGTFLSGGRYLFDTVEHAEAYKAWVERDFVLDGTRFFERPYFLNPIFHAWRVIGAYDFGDIRTSQIVVRSERWHRTEQDHGTSLDHAWPQVLADAEQRGLTSVWLLHNEQEKLAGIVSLADRIAPRSFDQPDVASLVALSSSPSLGTAFEHQGWSKTFDRTSWVLTIWFPFVHGDRGTAALWPNSPPLPGPEQEAVAAQSSAAEGRTVP